MASLILQVLLQAAFLLTDGSPPPPADTLIAHAESLLRRLQTRIPGVKGTTLPAPSPRGADEGVEESARARHGDHVQQE